ncbi:MAG: TetR/AcrR family transcriptional regulator [Sulfurovaceae bacterium]|nr:TetR/AcrR family transcriptional regulator [Sulfurovaceae bacterium]
MSPSTREKILDAVFKLVYIHGYNGTSMSMIIEATKLPKGSLYHHFKSKKDMVLAVIQERLYPRMDEFYALGKQENEHAIDTIINTVLKIATKDELIRFGCPLNRINQEMSLIDSDFKVQIDGIYYHIKQKIYNLLSESRLKDDVDKDSLSAYIIANVWGCLGPQNNSKESFLNCSKHLIDYLQSIKA